ncbi:PEP-CTERM sorting domain-containing protein [Nostoc sp. MBR 210]|uniref:DUF4114 domain-containing protein n=1 Tax=Nostoc spongiaeforme FACHB-130 TaxID=1357510 RepID=A0ABR8FVX6_9NOSO|nr:DUF4114 domain-containing protein [Nostoc spongiaeforme]MBD2595115.1 DUF4114 domain-containing protein [Nostoc spongiaeforme FACHB-130]OCQ89727.1 PEP-CTERM sorting domain-containing protein [Nostoc sp. MBR 210]
MKSSLFTKLFAATTLVTGLWVSATPANAVNIQSRNEAPVEFKDNIQDFKDFVGKESRYLSPETIGAHKVDLSQLTLKYAHDTKVFFIGETAGGYRNRLDFQATYGDTVTTGKIFGDTSCSTKDSAFQNFKEFCANPNDALANKTQQDSPLKVGDWVSLGKFQAGTTLDFLLHSNDINGGISGKNQQGQTVKGVFGLNEATNPDGLQHVMTYVYKNFLVLGYEDLWGGGDKDYNDVVFAIDIGSRNATALTKGVSVPEPSATLALVGIGAVGVLKTRRRSLKKANS